MKVGFTYDLRDEYLKKGFSPLTVAEFDNIEAIEAIDASIASMGHTVDRIGNAFSLMERLLKGERWDIVFNICEGLYGTGREALVPSLLDNYLIPYTFSDPLTHSITLNKGVTKRLLKSYDLSTTDFKVVKYTENLQNVEIEYPLFVKAIGEGTGKGISPSSIVKNFIELKNECEKLIKKFSQPVIVEPYLSGREVTVGILKTGKDAFVCGVLNVEFTEYADSNIHSYYNKENCDSACIYTLAKDEFSEECAELALKAHRALRLADASRVDIKADKDGKPFIIELNSLPGLAPNHSDLIILAEQTGLSHRDVVKTILESAIKRTKV